MINIRKASGESVPFDQEKLKKSLLNVGTDQRLINLITHEASEQLVEGMSTSKIYSIAFRLLRRHSQMLASKYHLKRAIMRLGVTGYPFEKYVGALLEMSGYQTKTNQIIKGHCISHEVDVVATKDKLKSFIECKYHNRQGKRCDVKVTLYIQARFLDITKKYKLATNDKLSGWVVTNTRFTADAAEYGLCVGLNLIGWDFPHKHNLKNMIEFSRLYPITCINSLTHADLKQLFSNNVILCKTIAENPSCLDTLKLTKQRKLSILNQCSTLCEN